MGAFFFCGATLTNRTGPVGPNRHTFPTAAMCRTEVMGQGSEYITGGQGPPCGVKDAAKRLPVRFIRTGGALFGAPLTAPWSDQGQAREAGAVRAPRTRSVRGVGSHARVSPAAPAMPDTYSVCVAAPYALFSGHTPLSDTQVRTRSWLSEPQSSPLVILVERPQPTVNTPHGRKRHFQSVPQSRPAEYRHGDRPVPAVEDQSHSIVIEVDGPEENIHHSPAVVLVVDISPFQRVEKRFDLRCGERDLLSHLNGKLALQLVLRPCRSASGQYVSGAHSRRPDCPGRKIRLRKCQKG